MEPITDFSNRSSVENNKLYFICFLSHKQNKYIFSHELNVSTYFLF